jgi:NADPH:quinone reductase-like Zn-dependent oxidoreductase
MPYSIPSEMRVLQVEQHYEDVDDAIRGLKLVTKPVPRLKPGQVLVKIEAAPCNPSDLLYIQGRYPISFSLPTTPGLEGAGTVVASGGGWLGRLLVGRRVSCARRTSQGGTWAEYAVVDAKSCIPLKSKITFEQGATLLINPLTAYAMIEKVKNEKHAAFVNTAAASQLGRMLSILAAQENIPVINTVRRAEQEDLLLQSGAKFVLNSEHPRFEELLHEYAHDLKATLAYDAIAGKMTGKLFNALPKNSIISVYGTLSMQQCEGMSLFSLIADNKRLEGFMLSSWIDKKNFWSLYRATSYLQNLIIKGIIETSVRKIVPLQDAPKALLDYQHEMTAGKILITPFH